MTRCSKYTALTHVMAMAYAKRDNDEQVAVAVQQARRMRPAEKFFLRKPRSKKLGNPKLKK